MTYSIIIPIFNCENYLSRCINSVVNQSFSEWELILIDDGSSDSSGTICDIYQKQFPEKIRVIHQDNSGVLYARRVGLFHAKGDYICFLDSDDSWDIGLLSVLEMHIYSYNPDIIFFGFRKVTPEGEIISEYSSENSIKLYDLNNLTFVYEKIIKGEISCLWAQAFRNALIDRDSDYSIYRTVFKGEDLLQNLALINNAKSALFIPDILYTYYQNPLGLTERKITKEYLDSHIIVQNVLMQYIDKWNLYKDKEARQLFIGVFNRVLKTLMTDSILHPKYQMKEKSWMLKYLSTGDFKEYLDAIDINKNKTLLAIGLFMLKKQRLFILKIYLATIRVAYGLLNQQRLFMRNIMNACKLKMGK